MIDDIAGGFTFTGRGQPQAFQVQPLVVYKVYADGRPDELVRGVDIVGTPLVSLTKILATGDTMEVFNGYCGAESGSVPVAAAAPAILISEMEVQKKETSTDKPPILPPPGHDTEGPLSMSSTAKKFASKRFFAIFVSALFGLALISATVTGATPARQPATASPQPQQAAAADSDKTLAAMQDELDRARTRLELKIPDTTDPARPYYIQYRILDLDVRTIVAEFGALISSTTGKNRIMSVDVRVGNYNLDSSNFITDEGFSGFLGSTGTVGIDRDYDSLRQDLWLATDQAFKAAVENFSKKQAFMSRLAKAPSIPDFSTAPPTVNVEPLRDPDWTTRNWEQEARAVSAALRQFPQLQSSRVTYHLIYTTSYLLNSEGTKIRANRSLAAIEASLETESDDGMPLHNFLAVYRQRPDELPAADAVRKDLEQAGEQLITLRVSPPAADYDGPVLFEAPAAGSLLAQMLGPSLSGARGPLAMQSAFDQLMDRLGGRSEWTGKLGTRVFPRHRFPGGRPDRKTICGAGPAGLVRGG